MKGTVTGVIHERGFGFIEGDDGREYFLHADELRGGGWLKLLRGARLEFTPMENGAKGNKLRATEAVLC